MRSRCGQEIPHCLARLAQGATGAGDTEGANQSAQAALTIDPHRRAALRTLAFLADEQPRIRTGSSCCGRSWQRVAWGRFRASGTRPRAGSDRQERRGSALSRAGAGAGYPDEKGALHALEARVFCATSAAKRKPARASAEARRLSDAFQARSKNSARNPMPITRREMLRAGAVVRWRSCMSALGSMRPSRNHPAAQTPCPITGAADPHG